jgi:hypothetical protein
MSNNQNINISQQNVTGPCDLKCAYNFNYQESSSTATNNGSVIVLSYDTGSVSPVLFNNQKYSVHLIYIVSPSIHTFNNTQAVGEILIVHSPVSGGPQLIVSIPFTSSSESSTASNLITQVIQSVANNAPSGGETTNLNIPGFNLNNIIPKKPFYNYSDSTNNSWIVFDIMNAIPISSSILTTLNKIIEPFPIPTPGTNLFYNSKGATNSTSNLGDGIYISCQPTGSSVEETNVSFTKNQTNYDISSLISNPVFIIIIQILIGCILFIITFLCINFVYNYFTKDKQSGGFTIG